MILSFKGIHLSPRLFSREHLQERVFELIIPGFSLQRFTENGGQKKTLNRTRDRKDTSTVRSQFLPSHSGVYTADLTAG